MVVQNKYYNYFAHVKYSLYNCISIIAVQKFKIMPITIEFEITPEKVRSLVFELNSKDQFAIIAAIINRKSKQRFDGFSQSDIRLLRGYLTSVLTEIEQFI